MKQYLAILLLTSGLSWAQPPRGERNVVRNTQDDVQRSASYSRLSGKERERNDNALRNLSRFDEKFSHGDFDKAILDQAIDDVKNITENNTLRGEDRDRLVDDLQRLRDFRKRHG